MHLPNRYALNKTGLVFIILCALLLSGCNQSAPDPASLSSEQREQGGTPGGASTAELSVAASTPEKNPISEPLPAEPSQKASLPSPDYPEQASYEKAVTLLKSTPADEVTPELEKEAFTHATKAADAGNPAAQHLVALCYLHGIGTDKNPEEALLHMQRSAEQNHGEAQFKLASLYAFGTIVPQDYEKAATWAGKAAENGHLEAQYNLATLYTTGRGVPQDDKIAAQWFQRAAEKGHPIAQSNLGVLYASGKGFATNLVEAVKWWKKAAEQGQPSAQYNLAHSFRHGNGVEKDLLEAYKWYSLAAERGDREAAIALEEVALELSPNEIADALRRARETKIQLRAKAASASEAAF